MALEAAVMCQAQCGSPRHRRGRAKAEVAPHLFHVAPNPVSARQPTVKWSLRLLPWCLEDRRNVARRKTRGPAGGERSLPRYRLSPGRAGMCRFFQNAEQRARAVSPSRHLPFLDQRLRALRKEKSRGGV